MAEKSDDRSQSRHLDFISPAPEDLMFGLSASYRRDECPQKVDLGVGAYRHDDGKPWVLPVVTKAKELLSQDLGVGHEYLPIQGLQGFVEASQELMFGLGSAVIKDGRVSSMQTLSGTGALHLGASLLARFIPNSPAKTVYVSDPPYANHLPILHHVGLNSASYPYYSPATHGLDLDGLLSALERSPEGSIILLHACAHNPTGVDPKTEHWMQIAKIMKSKNHLPFFDCAYQGFASGDIEADVWSIRHFIDQGFRTVIVAQSYAKNMGLYGERVGCLHVVSSTSKMAERVLGQLKRIQRVTISTPPSYGARLVALILSRSELHEEWLSNLRAMHNRITQMRTALRARLESNGTPGTWNHITEQRGMFCFSGLNEKEVHILRRKYHIYTTPDGRFSVAGLQKGNVDYVAQCIRAAVNYSQL